MKMENEPVQMVMEGLLQSVIQDGMHVDMREAMDGLSLQNDDNGMQMKGVQYQQQDCHEPMDMQHLIFNYLAEQMLTDPNNLSSRLDDIHAFLYMHMSVDEAREHVPVILETLVHQLEQQYPHYGMTLHPSAIMIEDSLQPVLVKDITTPFENIYTEEENEMLNTF